MRAIGYWKEENTRGPTFFEGLKIRLGMGVEIDVELLHEHAIPQRLTGIDIELEEKELLIQYLQSGKTYSSWLGYSFCRFHCGVEDKLMGCCDLSDGYWVWPQGLSHYVEEHEVKLPREFIEHARDCSWEINSNLQLAEFGGIDTTFWDSWCLSESVKEPQSKVTAFISD